MKQLDRLLMTTGLWSGALPFILVGISMRFLPKDIPLFDYLIQPTSDYLSKYNNLFTGLLCLLPIFVVSIASYLKRRNIMNKNFFVTVVTSIVLSLVFTGFILYGLIDQARRIPNLLPKIDFIGMASLGICLVCSFLGVFLPKLVQNDFLGIKNKRTLESPKTWEIVHTNSSVIMIVGFYILGIFAAFVRGFWALVLTVVGMIAFVCYTLIYSNIVSNRLQLEKEKEEKEKSLY